MEEEEDEDEARGAGVRLCKILIASCTSADDLLWFIPLSPMPIPLEPIASVAAKTSREISQSLPEPAQHLLPVLVL
jgi:hypothetical protein